jgi:hypothetical protein
VDFIVAIAVLTRKKAMLHPQRCAFAKRAGRLIAPKKKKPGFFKKPGFWALSTL